MVTVTGFNVRNTKSGETFIALELTGGVEIVQSQAGRMYATVRKISMPSTFSKEIAEAMVGQKLDGEIVRVSCDPYEYTNKRTGEVLTLCHTYAYRPAGAVELIGHTRVQDLQTA